MSEAGTFQVSGRTIRTDNETWQIPNLTKIGKYVVKANNSSSHVWTGIGVFTIILCLYLLFVNGESGALIGAIIGIIVSIISISSRKRDKFGLRLETNSGSSDLFFSENENFIDEIILIIHKVMDQKDLSANYFINIKDQKIIDNSKREVTNVTNSQNVAVRSSAVRQSMSGFAAASENTEFEEFIRELRILADQSDSAPNRRIVALIDELSSGSANSRVVQAYWDEILSTMPSAKKLEIGIEELLQRKM